MLTCWAYGWALLTPEQSIDIHAASTQRAAWAGLIPTDCTKCFSVCDDGITLSDWKAHQSERWVIIYRTFPGRPFSVQSDAMSGIESPDR